MLCDAGEKRARWARSALPQQLWVLLLACTLTGAAESYDSLEVEGETANNGIFDPALAEDPLSGEVWLVYSAVSGDLTPWGPRVETHLARSIAGGTSFEFVAKLRASESGTLDVDGEVLSGVWNHEVPTLAYVASDPEAPWRLMTHRIFRRDEDGFIGQQNVPAYSWLELVRAASPLGPWERVTRLGSGPLPPSPIEIDQALNPLDYDLLGAARVYSEPAMLVRDGAIYLVLTALDDAGIGTVVLFVSLDTGFSFDIVGPLLDVQDAAALGVGDFDGASLGSRQGRDFLIASPRTADAIRDGAMVFEIADLASASLVEIAERPRLFERIELEAGLPGLRFGGQAHFHESAAVPGVLMNELSLDALPVAFGIARTEVVPLPEPARAWAAVAVVLTLRSLSRSRVLWMPRKAH